MLKIKNNRLRRNTNKRKSLSNRRYNMWWVQGTKDGGCGVPRDLFGVPRMYREAYNMGYVHGSLERKYACQTLGEVA